ncbi:hypothetical protein P3X46_000716 [Hevea brasiliensis]|uniref:Bromo domain-containing protein n=1 Tax=Hevea brasiliensis TaxID=3981 RepID=A0ABQ9NBV4_HEVBR|nr:uncharacterized protein LOC110665242 [Hevea brasiliensis]KAJ9189420.1 hypothetical protein P3X46_000716 [Hevea brasiliensis]
MGKIVEKSTKKKKGRPSLLDLQKRTLKEQQQQQQQLKQNQNRNLSNSNFDNSALHSSHNYKSATPTPLRRSTRRNPTSSSPEHDEDDDAVELNGKRREKKLKLVLKLPSSQKSEPDSASLNSNGSESKGEEDKAKASYHKKRKINAIGDGSGVGVSEKGGKPGAGANPTNNVQDSGPSTPVPDKKLLLFILDRLQKKDTYGVFSEPVDANELPDYHEVIEHPMDFGTVRKKLSSEVYTSLEQFEKDIFLICSNAMQYNAPDTIYFRQARSIQELAKKNFENLRQDSDDNEPEPKIVRRGRPPTKNFKKPVGRPLLEHAGSAVALDGGTLLTGGESTVWSNNDLRKGPYVLDKSSLADSSGRSHGSHNDAYWLTDSKFEKNDEGSMFKGNSMKYGKRQFVLDENRRNTYNKFSAGGREPSVFATFDAERKQLMAVGLLSEHGYARSLARFAANIGTIAWKIASKKIERSLPSGVMFGPGWVGEKDIPPQRALLLSSNPQGLPSPSQLLRLPKDSCAVVTSCSVELREKLSEKPEMNVSKNEVPQIHSASGAPQLTNDLSSSASTSTLHAAASKSEPCAEAAVDVFNSHGRFNILNSNTSMSRPRPPFQIHQSHEFHPGMNGFNGTYRFSLPAQMGKLVGAARPAGINFRPSLTDTVSTTNANFVHPSTENSLNLKNPKLSENSSAINSSGALPNSGNEKKEAPISGYEPRPSCQGSSPQPKPDSGLSPQQKSDSVPPDLNVRFQYPGSPSSSRVDSAQPDLALQL